jgi:hypothetical protein
VRSISVACDRPEIKRLFESMATDTFSDREALDDDHSTIEVGHPQRHIRTGV